MKPPFKEIAPDDDDDEEEEQEYDDDNSQLNWGNGLLKHHPVMYWIYRTTSPLINHKQKRKCRFKSFHAFFI